jgi:glutathione peroxidase
MKKTFAMKTVLFIVVPLTILASYVLIDNRKNKHLSFRQKMIKSLYPLIMKSGTSSAKVLKNVNDKQPNESVFNIPLQQIDGTPFNWQSAQGKKILLVNTASDCGFTPQYEALEALNKKYADKLVVIGFPCNEFKNQEKGSNENIAQFCRLNFGVSFPMMTKGSVKKTNAQQPLYQWLSNATKNGWNDQAPAWNFCKYLIDENGVLTHYFDSRIDPLGPEIEAAILNIATKP